MKARNSQIARRAGDIARALTVVAGAATLMSLVGCGQMSNPVAMDSRFNSALRTTAHGMTDARRAPVDDPVTAPENLQIADAGWAWHVTWSASSGDGVRYQIFDDRDGNGYSLLVTTGMTTFFVPKVYAPRFLRVAVRASDVSGNLSAFSAPAQSPGQQTGDDGSGSSGGGGGVKHTGIE